MQMAQLVNFLDTAVGSVSKLNNELAQLIGYKRVLNDTMSDKRKAIWYDPMGREISKMPDFTGNIEMAKVFLHSLVPAYAAAFVWREDGIFAAIDNQPPVKGSTIPIALCKAALLVRIRLDS